MFPVQRLFLIDVVHLLNPLIDPLHIPRHYPSGQRRSSLKRTPKDLAPTKCEAMLTSCRSPFRQYLDLTLQLFDSSSLLQLLLLYLLLLRTILISLVRAGTIRVGVLGQARMRRCRETLSTFRTALEGDGSWTKRRPGGRCDGARGNSSWGCRR